MKGSLDAYRMGGYAFTSRSQMLSTVLSSTSAASTAQYGWPGIFTIPICVMPFAAGSTPQGYTNAINGPNESDTIPR